MRPGDEVVVLGTQSGETISASQAVATYGMAMIELLPRMSLNLPRVYLRGHSSS